MPKTKWVDCGQDEPTPEMIRPPREPGGRLFLVQVAFFTRKGWSDTFDVRVRAKGMAGAIWQGVRQTRRERLKVALAKRDDCD